MTKPSADTVASFIDAVTSFIEAVYQVTCTIQLEYRYFCTCTGLLVHWRR